MEILMKNIKEIIPYDNNPRKNEKAIEVVMNSIREFGFKNPVVVDKDNIIIVGHTRLKAAKKLGLNEVPVIVASDLSEEQVKAFRIMDNKSSEFAEWDYEKLLNEINDLEEAYDDIASVTGFNSEELKDVEDSLFDLPDIDLEDELGDDKYTTAINIPQYEIKGDCPSISELVDDKKTFELIREINEAKIDDSIKEFLILAAQRHLAFNYQNVAEYYAHADKEVQELFERSALVIIDIDDAIKNGYVHLTEELNNILGR